MPPPAWLSGHGGGGGVAENSGQGQARAAARQGARQGTGSREPGGPLPRDDTVLLHSGGKSAQPCLKPALKWVCACRFPHALSVLLCDFVSGPGGW